MYCAKCGSEIPDGIKFCPNCGAPVARTVMQDAQETIQQAANSTPDPSRQGGQTVYPYQQAGQGANPYQQPVYGGAAGYGRQAGPAPGGYTQQPYGQAPQMNYQNPQTGYQKPQMGYQNPQMGYQDPQMNYQQSFTVQEPKKGKKGLVIGLVAAGIIALAAILLFVWPGFLTGSGAASTPEKTIKNFGAALQKMDLQSMVECFDPSSQKLMIESMDKLDFNLGGLDLSALVEMMHLKVDMQVADVTYGDDKTSCTAQVKMKMSYSFMGQSGDTEETTPIKLVKAGTKWYIDGSQMDLEDLVDGIMGGVY